MTAETFFTVFGVLFVIVIIFMALNDSEKKIKRDQQAKQQPLGRQVHNSQFDSEDIGIAANLVDFIRTPGNSDINTVSHVAGALHEIKTNTAREAAKVASKTIMKSIEQNRQNIEPQQTVRQPEIVYIPQPEPRHNHNIDDRDRYYNPRQRFTDEDEELFRNFYSNRRRR